MGRVLEATPIPQPQPPSPLHLNHPITARQAEHAEPSPRPPRCCRPGRGRSSPGRHRHLAARIFLDRTAPHARLVRRRRRPHDVPPPEYAWLRAPHQGDDRLVRDESKVRPRQLLCWRSVDQLRQSPSQELTSRPSQRVRPLPFFRPRSPVSCLSFAGLTRYVSMPPDQRAKQRPDALTASLVRRATSTSTATANPSSSTSLSRGASPRRIRSCSGCVRRASCNCLGRCRSSALAGCCLRPRAVRSHSRRRPMPSCLTHRPHPSVDQRRSRSFECDGPLHRERPVLVSLVSHDASGVRSDSRAMSLFRQRRPRLGRARLPRELVGALRPSTLPGCRNR